jgi:hypothetical protein
MRWSRRHAATAAMSDGPELLIPEGVRLRDPQPRSIRGILRVWEHGALVGEGTAIGPILADSMGLGKTASTIIAANTASMRRVLVIAPKAALTDWKRELRARHSRLRTVSVMRAGERWLWFEAGWALINYEILDRVAEEIRARQWDLLVIDEGHAAKEPNAKRTAMIYGGMWRGKAVRPIPARKAIVISGTPLKNRIEELFTALNFLDRHNWPDREAFIDRYYESANAMGWPRIVTDKGRVVQSVAPRNLGDLHRCLKATVLVRTHKDDVAGLPSKSFEKIIVPLLDASIASDLLHLNWRAFLTSLALREARMRDDWREAERLEERLKQIASDIKKEAARQKREAVLEYLLTLKRKAVVIGFHRQDMLDQLAEALRRHGRRVVEHNGDTSDRTSATVEAFQTDAAIQFFVGQLNVSSLSLTLHRADHIVFAEIPDTRADFDQAMDRIHRFGQHAPEVKVTVFALDFPDAGDKKLLDALLHWKDVSDAVLDGKDPRSRAAWNWKHVGVWWEGALAEADDERYIKAELDFRKMFEHLFGRFEHLLGRLGAKQPPTERDKRAGVIAALLAKTVERGATEHEAEAARAKAHQMMKRYDITMKDIMRVVDGGA